MPNSSQSVPAIAICAGLLCLTLTLIGCSEDKHSRAEHKDDHSHDHVHTHDHDEPAHWPNDMKDAADLIQSRVELLTTNNQSVSDDQAQAVAELVDLVSWTPEIAADTELSEPEWIPIYELCEVIRRHMQANDVELAALNSDFQRLRELLVNAYNQLRIPDGV